MRKWSGDVSPAALAISVALHGAVVLFTSTARPVGTPPKPNRDDSADAWAGDTFDVELVGSRRAASRDRSTSIAEPPRAVAGAHVERVPRVVPRPSEPSVTRPSRSAPPETPGLASTATTSPVPPEPEHSTGTTSSPQVPSAARVATESAALGSPGGTFGAAGLPAGVRNLTRAFTRALPAAVLPAGAAWLDLPLGPGATALVTFTVGNDGKLVDFEIHDPEPPAYLVGLLRRAHLLLQKGQFALHNARQGGGEQTFRVRVQLERRPVADDPFADPGHIMRRGFTAPTPEQPGHAYFTFASGRHVDLRVSVESQPTPTVSRPR